MIIITIGIKYAAANITIIEIILSFFSYYLNEISFMSCEKIA